MSTPDKEDGSKFTPTQDKTKEKTAVGSSPKGARKDPPAKQSHQLKQAEEKIKALERLMQTQQKDSDKAKQYIQSLEAKLSHKPGVSPGTSKRTQGATCPRSKVSSSMISTKKTLSDVSSVVLSLLEVHNNKFYLSLCSENNVSTMLRKNELSGKLQLAQTRFSKLQIDPRNFMVHVSDYSFTDVTEGKQNQCPYGSAFSDAVTSAIQATTLIDLTGTHFCVGKEQFSVLGQATTCEAKYSSNSQRVEITVGGGIGACVPKRARPVGGVGGGEKPGGWALQLMMMEPLADPTIIHLLEKHNDYYYLVLPRTNNNLSTKVVKATDESGTETVKTYTISYSKVCVDPYTLMINTGDTTFTTVVDNSTKMSDQASTSSSGSESSSKKKMLKTPVIPFGCAVSDHPGVPAHACIDLQGTPFCLLDNEFCLGGNSARGDIKYSSGNQMVQLVGQGQPGWCSSKRCVGDISAALDGGWFLKLQLARGRGSSGSGVLPPADTRYSNQSIMSLPGSPTSAITETSMMSVTISECNEEHPPRHSMDQMPAAGSLRSTGSMSPRVAAAVYKFLEEVPIDDSFPEHLRTNSRGSPVDKAYYATLWHKNSSTFKVPADKPFSKEDTESVITTWFKVRVDPVTLKLNTADFKFSHSSGRCSKYAELSKTAGFESACTSIPFGSAFDSDSPYSMKGEALIDLRGTPFAVAENQFKHNGYKSNGEWKYQHHNQQVDLKGGGYSGWVCPIGAFSENEAIQGGWHLQLIFLEDPNHKSKPPTLDETEARKKAPVTPSPRTQEVTTAREAHAQEVQRTNSLVMQLRNLEEAYLLEVDSLQAGQVRTSRALQDLVGQLKDSSAKNQQDQTTIQIIERDRMEMVDQIEKMNSQYKSLMSQNAELQLQLATLKAIGSTTTSSTAASVMSAASSHDAKKDINGLVPTPRVMSPTLSSSGMAESKLLSPATRPATPSPRPPSSPIYDELQKFVQTIDSAIEQTQPPALRRSSTGPQQQTTTLPNTTLPSVTTNPSGTTSNIVPPIGRAPPPSPMSEPLGTSRSQMPLSPGREALSLAGLKSPPKANVSPQHGVVPSPTVNPLFHTMSPTQQLLQAQQQQASPTFGQIHIGNMSPLQHQHQQQQPHVFVSSSYDGGEYRHQFMFPPQEPGLVQSPVRQQQQQQVVPPSPGRGSQGPQVTGILNTTTPMVYHSPQPEKPTIQRQQQQPSRHLFNVSPISEEFLSSISTRAPSSESFGPQTSSNIFGGAPHQQFTSQNSSPHYRSVSPMPQMSFNVLQQQQQQQQRPSMGGTGGVGQQSRGVSPNSGNQQQQGLQQGLRSATASPIDNLMYNNQLFRSISPAQFGFMSAGNSPVSLYQQPQQQQQQQQRDSRSPQVLGGGGVSPSAMNMQQMGGQQRVATPTPQMPQQQQRISPAGYPNLFGQPTFMQQQQPQQQSGSNNTGIVPTPSVGGGGQGMVPTPHQTQQHAYGGMGMFGFSGGNPYLMNHRHSVPSPAMGMGGFPGMRF